MWEIVTLAVASKPERLQAHKASLREVGLKPTFIHYGPEPVNGDGYPSRGARGCAEGHGQILSKYGPGVLVLEDDAVARAGTRWDLNCFLDELPENWEALWLGGQHHKPPEQISTHVVRCVDVYRTHAYVIRSKELADYLAVLTEIPGHVDLTWRSILHQAVVYAPSQWLFGQGAGQSTVWDRQEPERWFDFEGAPCR